MSKVSDKILEVARKRLEAKDRRGETIPDMRGTKNFDKFVRNAEKSGIISRLKSGTSRDEDGPTYVDGVEAFVNSKQFENYKRTGKSGEGELFEWDPSKALYMPNSGQKQFSGKAPGISTVSDIRTELTTERSDVIIPLGVRERRLRTIYPNIPTSGSSYKQIRETGFTNNAAGRPENVDPASTTSASESRISTDFFNVDVEIVDHAIPFPKELMDDLPALIAYVRQRGVDGVDDTEDANILSGAGPGSHEFLGLLTDSDVATYAWSDGDADDNMADAVLGAMVEVITAEYMPDHVLLSVMDHALIAKLKDDNGNYLFPFAHRRDNEFALWGVETIKTTALSTGSGLTGASRAAEYRPRQGIGFRLTDSHASYFLDNVLYLVVERRAGFRASRPESFREIDFDNAPA